MKKKLALLLAGILCVASLTACGSSTDTTETTEDTTAATTEATTEDTEEATEEAVAQATGAITVVTREDGSGTRGAFTEICGILDEDGNDITTVEATVISSTGGVLTAVASDTQAIGYISLGSLNDTVKAVTVEGVEATSENILSGEYAVARPFNIAVGTGADLDPIAEELIAYIFSAEGQEIVEAEGYIPVEVTTEEFVSEQPSGSITVGGSTSVNPVMEAIIEAYNELNPNATINLEGGGSSAGMSGAIDGTFDIGMASREMKDSELESLTGYVMAQDGIAVIVNNENVLEDVSLEDIMNIYTSTITTYDELY
ncbi:MAG: substrate-binding domain-containing protein [Eubacteriales bacterium]